MICPNIQRECIYLSDAAVDYPDKVDATIRKCIENADDFQNPNRCSLASVAITELLSEKQEIANA